MAQSTDIIISMISPTSCCNNQPLTGSCFVARDFPRRAEPSAAGLYFLCSGNQSTVACPSLPSATAELRSLFWRGTNSRNFDMITPHIVCYTRCWRLILLRVMILINRWSTKSLTMFSYACTLHSCRENHLEMKEVHACIIMQVCVSIIIHAQYTMFVCA